MSFVNPCNGESGCDERSNTRIANVTVRNAQDIGFVINEDVDSVRCVSCSAIDSGSEGFFVAGANTFMSGCLATGSVEAGIEVSNTSSATLIVDCDVRDNFTGPSSGDNIEIDTAAASATRVRNTVGFCQTGDSDCWTP